MGGPGLWPEQPHRCAFMPGAISRTTGSATKWNSFTPSFMRHSSVQPFSVTTGLLGQPLDGISGGWGSALSMLTISGSAAWAAGLTVATAAAPPNLKKSRLEAIKILSVSAHRVDRRGRDGSDCSFIRCAGQCHPHVGIGEPEIALRLDGGVHRRDLRTRVGQQLEHADQHAVVAILVFLGDALLQWHHLVAQVAGDGVLALLHGIGLAHLGTRVDRDLACALECLAVERFDLHKPGQHTVEQRQYEAEIV